MPTSSRPLRVVIVGTGFMARVHSRAACNAGADVIGIVGRTRERAEAAAQLLRIDNVSASLPDLLDRAEPDVVHVCTPNNSHDSHVRAALAAGAHVVCEKPLVDGRAAAESLLAAATAADVVHAVPFVYRFYPMVHRMRDMIASGELGRIRIVHGHYLQDWLADPSDANWRVDAASGGRSRTFADIGVHWCDLAEFVTGQRIARLVAQTAAVVPRCGAPPNARSTEDVVTMSFVTDAGAVGAVTLSQVSIGRKNELVIAVDGSDRAAEFAQEEPNSLWLGGRKSSSLISRGAADAGRYDVLPPGHPQGYQDAFDAFVADVYQAVAGATPEGLPTFVDGVRAATLTDAVLQSAVSGTWVEPDSLDG